MFEVDPPYNFTVCIDGPAGLLFTAETDVVNEVTVESTQRALDSQPGRDAALIVEAVNALPELLDAHDRMAGALRDVLATVPGGWQKDAFAKVRAALEVSK